MNLKNQAAINMARKVNQTVNQIPPKEQMEKVIKQFIETVEGHDKLEYSAKALVSSPEGFSGYVGCKLTGFETAIAYIEGIAPSINLPADRVLEFQFNLMANGALIIKRNHSDPALLVIWVEGLFYCEPGTDKLTEIKD